MDMVDTRSDIRLVRRITADDMALMTERFTLWKDLPGNPGRMTLMDIAAPDDGPPARALITAGFPGDPWLNRVLGLRPGMETVFPALAAHYREAGVTMGVEIAPGNMTPALADALSGEGLRHTGFNTHYVAALKDIPDEADEEGDGDVKVRPVSGAEDMARFLEAQAAGWEMSPEEAALACQGNAALSGLEDWHLFNAWVGDEVAGIGILTCHGSLGCLTEGAVVPRFRGRGAQRALLRARLRKARQLRATMVWSQTDYGLHSAHNMERVGLRVGYTLAMWALP